MKTCTKCNTEKPLEEFYKNRGDCIVCFKIKTKKYREENYEKIKTYKMLNRNIENEKRKIDRKNNPEKYRIKKLKYYEKNKEKIKEQSRLLHKKHREKRNNECKRYYEKNKKEILYYRRKYKQDNKEKVQAKKYELHKFKLANDPYYHLTYRIRQLVIADIKNYTKLGKKALTCKGYGIDFKAIYDRIGEKPEGDYHVDHIIPIIKFDLNIPEHVKLAHHPSNLRWITATENIIKKDKIILELILNNKELLDIANKIGLVLPNP